MTNDLVSVILPCYNRVESLTRAARTVLDQSYANLELLVVDDGSSQDVAGVVGSLNDPRVRLVRHPTNMGAAAARNTGVAEARGSFIAFQDSDDEWLPGKLERQMAALQGAPRAGFVYSDMERVTVRGGQEVRETYPAPDVRKGVLLDPARLDYATRDIGLQTCMFRRDALKAAGPGPFDASLRRFIDLELLLRVLRHHAGVRVAEPLVRYHLYGEGISFNEPAAADTRVILLERYGADGSRAFRAHQHRLIGRLRVRTGRLATGMSHFWHAAYLDPRCAPAAARDLAGAYLYRLRHGGHA